MPVYTNVFVIGKVSQHQYLYIKITIFSAKTIKMKDRAAPRLASSCNVLVTLRKIFPTWLTYPQIAHFSKWYGFLSTSIKCSQIAQK